MGHSGWGWVPWMPRVVSVSLCKGPGAAEPTARSGPSLWGCPSPLLVFLLGLCRSFPCFLPTLPPASAATAHQYRLGVLATQGSWNGPEPVCSQNPCARVRLAGSTSQVPLGPLLPAVILRGTFPTQSESWDQLTLGGGCLCVHLHLALGPHWLHREPREG